MSKKENIFKSKFEGIFPVSQSEELLKEFKDLIKILITLSKSNELKEFYLKPDIIKIIFGEFDEIVNSCTVSDEFSHFTIALNFPFKGIDRYKIINLKKNEYKFLFKDKYYYCFDMDSMKNYLNDLLIHYQYYIEVTSLPYAEKKIKDIEQFLMLDYYNFKILIDYQFKDIDYNNFDYNSIYNLPNIITGPKLNLKLGHYVSLTEEDFNNFEYYDTEERQQFYKGFKRIIGVKNVFGLCGPYGTGKTITMLKTCK